MTTFLPLMTSWPLTLLLFLSLLWRGETTAFYCVKACAADCYSDMWLPFSALARCLLLQYCVSHRHQWSSGTICTHSTVWILSRYHIQHSARLALRNHIICCIVCPCHINPTFPLSEFLSSLVSCIHALPHGSHGTDWPGSFFVHHATHTISPEPCPDAS